MLNDQKSLSAQIAQTVKITDKNLKDLTILLSQEEVEQGVKEIAKKINGYFGAEETLYLICVLKGSAMFFADLAKHLVMPVQMEFIRLSSYGDDDKSSGRMKSIDLNLPILEGKNVLIIEDIIDTGYTAKFLLNLLEAEHRPNDLKFAAFLNKAVARQVNIEPDFYSYNVDDKFLIGYGLDYKGYFRNLPYVGYFNS